MVKLQKLVTNFDFSAKTQSEVNRSFYEFKSIVKELSTESQMFMLADGGLNLHPEARYFLSFGVPLSIQKRASFFQFSDEELERSEKPLSIFEAQRFGKKLEYTENQATTQTKKRSGILLDELVLTHKKPINAGFNSINHDQDLTAKKSARSDFGVHRISSKLNYQWKRASIAPKHLDWVKFSTQSFEAKKI